MNLTKALQYAKQGINVFPCKPDTKAPRTRNGFNDATVDAKKIRRWWTNHPNDLIGGLCDDTFTVIDVDCGGKCPEEQKKIILSVVDHLKSVGVITDNTPAVRTMSGGFHYYLRTNDKFHRRINYLPAIDLLAKGGYVILPDEKVYTSINTSLLESFKSLEDVDHDTLFELHKEYDFVRKEVKYHIDLAKGKKPRKPKAPRDKTVTEKADDIDIYAKTEVVDLINPMDTILDENGQIHIDAYTLDSHLINRLFLNQEVQRRLGTFLGLNVPKKTSQTTLWHSILVGHADNNPSMGVRWAKADTHIIARDFSDHYSDELVDYNVVRLYMNKMYGHQVKKPSKAEWTTWFLRLMVEANIINVDHLLFSADLTAIFGSQKKKIKAAEHIFLLDAIKRLHSQYDEQFACSKRFMEAWCRGIHKNTSYLALKELVAAGVIKHVHSTELSEKRKLFLYTIIHEENKESVKSVEEKINIAKKPSTSLPAIIKSRRTEHKTEETPMTTRKMSEMEKWLLDDDNWDTPVDMAEMDRIDAGGDWDDIPTEAVWEGDLNSDDNKPP